tara:strand:- start:196 stop:507 length:312 start_codon:yes stop_codon:yes gene_type:complete
MIVSYYDAVREIVGIDNMIGGNINGPISKIEFVEGFTDLPTEEQIQAKLAELQAEYDANQYQRDRAVEYPSIEDQLDEIFHKGLTEWKKTIQAVKDKHPKPTE